MCDIPEESHHHYGALTSSPLHSNQSVHLGMHLGSGSNSLSSGEHVLKILFADFVYLSGKKIERVMKEPYDSKIADTIQLVGDEVFDQLLASLRSVAEFCLPSILTTLFKWHQVELGQTGGEETNGERTWCLERRELVVTFLFCLAVIEVLKMLHLHPVPECQIVTILNMTFSYFRCLDPPSPPGAQLSASMGTGPSSTPPILANVRKVADLFAEMLGVLSQACYVPVHKRFLLELQINTLSPDMAINTIRGMSLLRVKMFPVEEVEAWFLFLQRCAEFLIEVRDPRIKNSMAYTLVEILIPVSIVIRLEVSLPPVKKFVDQLFSYSLELLSRKKDRYTVTIFPLLTMLLSVSQTNFFIFNWHPFLTLCLNNLRSRNSKVARIALECVYRLVWVYVVRIKCESNTQTYSRLKQVMDSLFPKGARGLIPKEGPIHYFVRIIHVVAREKLDFAIREVVMELIACKGSKPAINPERMNIGFRAFFAIADSLERQEEEPPSPSSTIVLPSGTMPRTRRNFLTHTLTDNLARQIGLQQYLPGVKRALGQILRHLDNSVGKPLLATNTQSLKNPEEILSSDRKAKVELLRTCVASIPRCSPDGYPTDELVEFLSRCTIHCDHDLNVFAFSALQSLQEHNPAIRPDIIKGVVSFILKEVPDSCPLILDMGIRMLIVLLTHWRDTLSLPPPQDKPKSKPPALSSTSADLLALRQVEALGLVLICANRQLTRKKTFELLKEALQVSQVIPASGEEESVYSLIDKAGPQLTQVYLSQLAPEERHTVRGELINIEWLSERLSQKGVPEEAWTHCLASLFSSDLLPTHCPSAVALCWPFLSNRLLSLYSAMYPRFNASLPLPSVSGSAIRSKKFLDPQDVSLFQNYLLVSCSIVPGLSLPLSNPLTPHIRQQTRESLTDSVSSQGSFTCESPPPSSEVVMTSHDLFHWILPMIKSETIEMQRSVVYALGKVHPAAFLSLMEELQPFLKEAGDKNETVRRRKRRSGMRIEVAHILEMNASLKCFTLSPLSSRPDLLLLLSSYLENTRILLLLEAESDRMHKWKYTIKSHFASLVAFLYWEIGEGKWNEEAWGVLCSYDLRSQLYTFFTSSCGLPRLSEGDCSPARKCPSLEEGNSLSLVSLDAMSALACCGPLFDPAGLEPDGYLISWLTSILESPVLEIQQIACRTVQSLLRHNLDCHPLLNWLLSHCYTSPSQIASDLSFSALSRVFSRVSYPCEPVSLMHLSLLKSTSPDPQTREEAVNLLHVLESRHLVKESLPLSVGAYVARRGDILVRHFSSHHPELTIPIFSDMVYRIDGASQISQRSLLQLILPWLSNIELVDVLVLPLQDTQAGQQRTHSGDTNISSLRGTGWGCHQASELVLNNLLFLTIEHSLEFSHEIEQLWGSLCAWSHNVGYIYSYLLQVIGLGLTPRMLHYAKSILCYLARTSPGPVISLLLRELSSVEIISGYLESISPPPYFQVRPGRHYLLSTTLTQSDTLVFQNDTLLKSQYQSDLLMGIMGRSVSPPPRCDSRSTSVYAAIPLSRSRSIGAGIITDPKGKLYENRSIWRKSQGMEFSHERLANLFLSDPVFKDTPPEARSAPLSPPKLPSRSSTVGTKSTWLSNSSSVLGDEIPVWVKVWGNKTKPHPLPVPGGSVFYARLTKFLHLGVPGLPLHRCNFSLMLLTQVLVDQSDHAWERDLPLLLHVLFLGFDHLQPLVSEHCKHLLVSLLVILANRQEPSLAAQLLMLQQQLFSQSSLFESTESFHAEPLLVVSDPSHDILARSRLQKVEEEIQSILSQGTNCKSSSTFHLVARLLSNDAFKPIWPKDDITPQSRQLASANQINSYIHELLGILAELNYPGIRDGWSNVSLSWALGCTSRHYACRSFQICRALNIQLSANTTHQIVSRLVEAVSDSSEEVQGYVMEILLTLSAGVDQLIKSLPAALPLPNTSEPVTPLPGKARVKHTHKRSNSSGNVDKPTIADVRNKAPSRPVSRRSSAAPSSLSISPRRESITLTTPSSHEEEQLLQVLLVSLCLLTSDFTHQYSMALKLFSSCLDGISIGSPAVEDQLHTYIKSMLWEDYPGVQGLLLKGLTSSQLYEDSLKLIGRMTPHSCSPVFYPTPILGLPRNILILLPLFVVNFSHQDEVAKQFSSLIAQTCKEVARGDDSLESLGTLFHMYSLKSYHQPVHMWLASVSKFLNSAFSDHVLNLAGTLLDLLEEGVPLLQKPILQILGPFVKQMDQSRANFPNFYKSLLRGVCVFLKTPLWESCIQLLQDAVCECSSLERPPTPVYNDEDLHLPGPIMRFTLDISHTLQREFRTQEQCKQKNSLAPGWDRCVPSCNTTQDLLTRALAVMTSESHPSVSRSSSVLFNSDMDKGISAFYASYTSPTPLESPTLKQVTSPADQDNGSYVDVDLLLHKAFNFLDEVELSDHDMSTVDSNVGLPWGVKLKKPLVDTEYTPSDQSESQECYQGSQPMTGGMLDVLQSWEQEQDPVDIMVPESQDEYPSVQSAVPPPDGDTSAPSVDPWGHERTSEVSLTGDDSVTDSIEGISSREISHTFSPDLSDSETGGYDSSCQLLPPTAYSMFLFVEREDIEDTWVNHTSDVSGDMCQAVHTFHLFNKLFRECRDGFISLTTEACNYITESHKGIASKLIIVIEIIMNEWECPLVFIDHNVITGVVCVQMDKFLFFLMEIKNDFNQYNTKKRQAQESLDLLKRSLRSLHPGEDYSESSTSVDMSPSGKLSPQALVLCRALYRMHFQFLVFLGSYNKLLGIVESWRYLDDVFDISNQLEPVRKQLSTFLSPLSTPTCEGVVLEKKFMFGSPGKSRKFMNYCDLERGLKLTRVERHKSHGASKSMHQLEGQDTGVKRNKSMGTTSYPLLNPYVHHSPPQPIKTRSTEACLSPPPSDIDISSPHSATNIISHYLATGGMQEAIHTLNEARIKFPSDTLGTGPEDNLECLLLILAQSFLSDHSGVLGLTGGSQLLGEVHNNLMANNVNLYSLLEHYDYEEY